MQNVQKILESHPDWPAVTSIYHTLKAHGYKGFLAGGSVRDALLGLSASDLDLATDATPEEIERLFSQTVSVGKAFGVMRVLVEGADIEVATFRTDKEYKDGRRPEGVLFSSPEEDARRRDFTINALFYDLDSNQVLDFVDGIADLRKGLIRTVGEAAKRFEEDHLRLLRAARFAAQLGFVIEPVTLEAIAKMAPLVKSVSGERLRDEMSKLLRSPKVQCGLQVMQQTGMMKELFPHFIAPVVWSGDFGAQEPWQRLALFLRVLPPPHFVESLQLLKLSTQEQKNIKSAWSLWQQPEAFFATAEGAQLQKLSEPGVLWALRVLQQETSIHKEPIQKRLAQWEAWGHQLPRAFLTGDDLLGALSGKNLGECLKKAYELQLEKKINNREEALDWVQNFLKRESHG